jgi:hypothetical protein
MRRRRQSGTLQLMSAIGVYSAGFDQIEKSGSIYDGMIFVTDACLRPVELTSKHHAGA